MNRKEVKRLVAKFWPIYWRQLYFNGEARFTLFGILKGEEKKPMKHIAYFDRDVFRQCFLKLNRKEGAVEIYGSLCFVKPREGLKPIMLFKDDREAYVYSRWIPGLDVDADDNDLSNLKPVYKAWRILKNWGLLTAVKLSGGGLHLSLLPYGLKLPQELVLKLPEAFEILAKILERKLDHRIHFCRKIYDLTHLFRLAFSWHAKREVFAIPVHPKMLLNHTIEDLREMAKDLEYVEKLAASRPFIFGKIVDYDRFLTILEAALPYSTDLKVKTIVIQVRRRRSLKGWRSVVDPVLGEIEYSARLEGYGWIKALVEEECLLVDGRNTMCWLILPEACHKGVLSLEEAKEYIKKTIEAYPDPETPLEHYLEKFEYEYNRQQPKPYGLPVWKSLIIERKKVPGKQEWSETAIAVEYRHVKYPILLALWQKSLIKLTEQQAEKLKQKVEEQLGRSLETVSPPA